MTPRQYDRAVSELADVVLDTAFAALSPEALALIANGRLDLAQEARRELARPRRTDPSFPGFAATTATS